MKHTVCLHVNIHLLFTIIINLANCQQSLAGVNVQPEDDDGECPLWFYFNTTMRQCECYTNPITDSIVRCTADQGAQLRVSYCMTHEEGGGLYLTHCHYFKVDANYSYKISDDNYIILPKNVSELNDYMCGPMNRKGRLCSECIDGFGPSFTSLGSVCSNCTDAWYGVPLYLFLEFVPLTVFYFIILIFKINLTSAPMVAFVLFSQLEVSCFVFHSNRFLLKSTTTHRFLAAITTLYGFWNLDFFRYIIPPLCLSPKLKLIHITFLYYVSAFYPLCLVSATWICIQMHSHNFKPIVWLWRKVNRWSFKLTKTHLDCSNSLTNAFATFFFLSYAKIVFISGRMLGASKVMNLRNGSTLHTYLTAEDPSFGYFSTRHFPYIAVSIVILLLAILPLIVILSFYPVKRFRLLLFKVMSTRAIASLNIFVERYHSCYRDGTDGGKDMRSLVSMYFLLRLLVSILFSEVVLKFGASTTFMIAATLSGGCSLLIALVRPYKRNYMNIVDALILGNLVLINLMLNYGYHIEPTSRHPIFLMVLCIFISLPLLGLIGFTCYKILKWLPIKRNLKWRRKSVVNVVSKEISQLASLEDGNSNRELPDRVLHPQQYNSEDVCSEYIEYKDETCDKVELYLSQ